jgi:hypothetical protein
MLILSFFGCNQTGKILSSEIFPDDVHLYTYEERIAPTTDLYGLHPLLKDNFDLYTNLQASNGGFVHLLSQQGISQAQLIRTRSILQFYLQDRPELIDGIKTDVFNEMANQEATLLLCSDEMTGVLNDLDGLGLNYQSIYDSEILVEGSTTWLDNSHHDSSFAKIFTLVYEYGIIVSLPDMVEKIEIASQQAIENGIWSPPSMSDRERRIQYLTNLIEVYYGYWGHEESAFDGEYLPHNRDSLLGDDQLGGELIESFFSPHIDFEVRLDENFTGIFDLQTTEFWGNKTQYFIQVGLSGNQSADIYGNNLDNLLQGNQNDNLLRGGQGEDTVFVTGIRNEYEIQLTDSGFILFDEIPERDGADYLMEIEWVNFADQVVWHEDIQPN